MSMQLLIFKILYSDLEHFSVVHQYLAAGVVPVKLPTPCINLTYLWLSVNFNDLKEISTALCVFRSSPNLKRIKYICEYSFSLALLFFAC